MGAEDRVENLDTKGYRSLGKMFQCPVRDTVRAGSLADLKTHDGFLNLVRVGQLLFAGRGHEVGPQRHVKHLYNSRDRGSGHRLKLSFKAVSKSFGFLSLRERFPPR
jgi:hypothetical protein